MQTFYSWIRENKESAHFPIVNYVNIFLSNFNPSKGNEKNFLHTKKYANELQKYPAINYNKYKLDTTIIPAFQQISQLNKDSDGRRYAPLIRRILIRVDKLLISDLLNSFGEIIDQIIRGIVRLYHQEIYLLNKDEIETAIENIIYDFNFNKSIINKIRIALNQFEFENIFQIFQTNVKEEIEAFVSINAFDNVTKRGVTEALYRFDKLISDASSSQNLSYHIKYIMHNL